MQDLQDVRRVPRRRRDPGGAEICASATSRIKKAQPGVTDHGEEMIETIEPPEEGERAGRLTFNDC